MLILKKYAFERKNKAIRVAIFFGRCYNAYKKTDFCSGDI